MGNITFPAVVDYTGVFISPKVDDPIWVRHDESQDFGLSYFCRWTKPDMKGKVWASCWFPGEKSTDNPHGTVYVWRQFVGVINHPNSCCGSQYLIRDINGLILCVKCGDSRLIGKSWGR